MAVVWLLSGYCQSLFSVVAGPYWLGREGPAFSWQGPAFSWQGPAFSWQGPAFSWQGPAFSAIPYYQFSWEIKYGAKEERREGQKQQQCSTVPFRLEFCAYQGFAVERIEYWARKEGRMNARSRQACRLAGDIRRWL